MIILKLTAIAVLLAMTVMVCVLSGKDIFTEQNV